MKLAVIIVSYNTCDLLRNCLHTVFAAAMHTGKLRTDNLLTDNLDVEVIVVDSASTDDSADMVAANFPQAHLIRASENIGFTRANNLALKTLGFTMATTPHSPPSTLHAPRPDFVLLLNPDTELKADTLSQMARFLQTTPHAGVCGAHLTYGDGRFQHGAFRFPSLAQVALDLFPLAELPLLHRLYDMPINGRFSQAHWQSDTPFPVDFVLGAAMMVRTAAIAQVGGLDEGFFMYCEEMDWCLRIQEAGWGVYAVPTAHVTHYEGQSSKQVRWEAYEWLWRSRFRFYEQHGKRYAAGHMFALRLLVWLGMKWAAWRAYQQFGLGKVTGEVVERELAAYRVVTSL